MDLPSYGSTWEDEGKSPSVSGSIVSDSASGGWSASTVSALMRSCSAAWDCASSAGADDWLSRHKPICCAHVRHWRAVFSLVRSSFVSESIRQPSSQTSLVALSTILAVASRKLTLRFLLPFPVSTVMLHISPIVVLMSAIPDRTGDRAMTGAMALGVSAEPCSLCRLQASLLLIPSSAMSRNAASLLRAAPS